MLKAEEGEDIANLSSTRFSTLVLEKVSGVFRWKLSQFLEEESDLEKCVHLQKWGAAFSFPPKKPLVIEAQHSFLEFIL